MKGIKGFKDGVYYTQWKDQQYSTTFWVLISETHSIKPCLQLLENFRSYPYADSDERLEIVVARCAEHYGSVYGHEIFLMFRGIINNNTISHELIHAKNFVFKYHGVIPDVDNDEHEAYYMGYLTSKLVEIWEEMEQALEKRNKKKNKPPKMKNARKT